MAFPASPLSTARVSFLRLPCSADLTFVMVASRSSIRWDCIRASSRISEDTYSKRQVGREEQTPQSQGWALARGTGVREGEGEGSGRSTEAW